MVTHRSHSVCHAGRPAPSQLCGMFSYTCRPQTRRDHPPPPTHTRYSKEISSLLVRLRVPGGCKQVIPTNREMPKVINCVSPIRHTLLVPNQIQGLGIPSMESNPQYFPPKLKQHHLFARFSNPLHVYACTHTYTCVCVHNLELPHKGRHPSTQYTHIPTQHTRAHDPLVHTKSCMHVYVPVCPHAHT